jgi:hypothetical protein
VFIGAIFPDGADEEVVAPTTADAAGVRELAHDLGKSTSQITDETKRIQDRIFVLYYN